MTLATRLLLVLCCLLLGACGERDEEEAAAPRETATATAGAASGGGTLGPIDKDLSKKPAIPKPEGDPPTTLRTEDVVEGKGPAAKAGDTVQMQYVGASWSTGEEFDASWDRGQPFSFPLGGGRVIPGWDRGIVGMKEGGRRLLVIPPDQGYGAQGQGPIKPNETLLFVADLVEIQ